MAEWAGIVKTTIRDYIRQVENDVMRNRKVLALVKAKANLSYGCSGDQAEWRIRYRRNSLQGMADGDVQTFQRQNFWKIANLDWRGYASQDMATKKEKLMNKGKEAIINRYSEITKLLLEDIEENFGDEFYVDGNASGNEKRIHGIESFMGTTGSAVVGTPVMAADDSYAGLNTVLGSYGGSWSGNWPKGKGSPEYDFYTPLIVDYTSSLAAASGGWTSATATWAARCSEVLRFAGIHSAKNKSTRGMIDMAMLEAEMYRLFVQAIATNERLVIERGSKTGGLQTLGFSDVVNYDGMEVTYEYGMPTGVGYGWNMDQVELNSLQDSLFVNEGPDYDIASSSWRFSIDFYGNMKFRPRYFFKLGAYGTNGA